MTSWLKKVLGQKVWEQQVSLIPSSTEDIKRKEGVKISCLSIAPSISAWIKSIFILPMTVCLHKQNPLCVYTHIQMDIWLLGSHEGVYWELNELPPEIWRRLSTFQPNPTFWPVVYMLIHYHLCIYVNVCCVLTGLCRIMETLFRCSIMLKSCRRSGAMFLSLWYSGLLSSTRSK